MYALVYHRGDAVVLVRRLDTRTDEAEAATFGQSESGVLRNTVSLWIVTQRERAYLVASWVSGVETDLTPAEHAEAWGMVIA